MPFSSGKLSSSPSRFHCALLHNGVGRFSLTSRLLSFLDGSGVSVVRLLRNPSSWFGVCFPSFDLPRKTRAAHPFLLVYSGLYIHNGAQRTRREEERGGEEARGHRLLIRPCLFSFCFALYSHPAVCLSLSLLPLRLCGLRHAASSHAGDQKSAGKHHRSSAPSLPPPVDLKRDHLCLC